MQVCEQCGTTSPDRARFCTSCGGGLAADGGSATPSPPTYAGVLVPPDPGPRRRPWVAGAAVLGALLLLAGGFALGRAVEGSRDVDEAGGGGPAAEADQEQDPPVRVVPGRTVELPVDDGTATAELLVADRPGVVLRVDEGTVSLTDEAGAPVADDADSDVLDLEPGIYTVRVDGVDSPEVALTAGEVLRGPLPGDRSLAGELSETVPVVEASLEPTAYQAWSLVDSSPDEVDAVLHDVTDLAEGEDPMTDAPVVCDGFERECLLEPGRRYLVRIRALNLPASYDITFDDVLARSGPSSVLVDGEATPQVVALSAGETVTVDLAIGHRGDVVLWITPPAGVDVAVSVAGREVDGAGPGAAEAIRVTAAEVEEAFGFLDLDLAARGGGGPAFVTAERR